MSFNSLKRIPVFAHVINVPFSLSQTVINITTISTQDLSVLHDYNLIYFCFESTANMQRTSDVRVHPSKNSRSSGRAPRTGSNKTRAKRPERKLCKNDPDPLSFDDWLDEEARYRAEKYSEKFATCRQKIDAEQEENRDENRPMWNWSQGCVEDWCYDEARRKAGKSKGDIIGIREKLLKKYNAI
ncbi:hypothetical protein BPAE_0088g00040 [Botrytis paeoniae]|uniref:Uncharacterized protein n=1 Tax=Botrytis paeoniae TaxID=278948 RepID=A0A4Z1FQB0_9HELO|nr:hypothetical protein BPAE_0088g00040 [Botrytis paeoniae]